MGNTWAMMGHLFSKMFKIWTRFQKWKKNSEKVFCFWDNSIWIGCIKLSVLRREYLPSELNLLKNSLKILHITNRDLFVSQLHSDWSINMVKVLSFKFQQCLGAFTMLLFEGSSETGPFRHWSNHVFRSG